MSLRDLICPDGGAFPSRAATVAAQVSGARLARRLGELGRFGATAEGGVNRQAFGAADRQARSYMVDWARGLGLGVATDPIGNQFFRLSPPGCRPDAPAWVAGSHLDSQPAGGLYDGALGVVAAMEAVEALIAARAPLAAPVEVVVWSNEEGSRYAPGCMGSMAYTGRATLDRFQWLVDSAGFVLAHELFATLAETDQGALREFGTPMRGYLELHVEQGPVLERMGLPVAVVQGIQGYRWFEVDIRGRACHAGTTPMAGRADALREAVAAIAAMQRALDDPQDLLRLTVGRFRLSPGAPNTVPDHANFTIDLRHPEEAVLTRAEAALRVALSDAMTRCGIEIRRTAAQPPCTFDAGMQAALAQAAQATGVPHTALASGAFHDASFMAGFCPTAMLFVPSRDGLSHHPGEHTEPADILAGARVLAATLARLAGPAPSSSTAAHGDSHHGL